MQNLPYELNEFDLHEYELTDETYFHLDGFTRRLILTQGAKRFKNDLLTTFLRCFLSSISFPEPTAKTRSYGIINNLFPWPEPTCLLLSIFDTAVLSKPNSTFLAFPVRILGFHQSCDQNKKS